MEFFFLERQRERERDRARGDDDVVVVIDEDEDHPTNIQFEDRTDRRTRTTTKLESNFWTKQHTPHRD